MQQVYKVSLYPNDEARADNMPMSYVWVEEATIPGVQTFAEKVGLVTKVEHVVGFVDLVTAMECITREAERVYPAQTEAVN